MYYSRSLENVNQVYVFFILTRFINEGIVSVWKFVLKKVYNRGIIPSKVLP